MSRQYFFINADGITWGYADADQNVPEEQNKPRPKHRCGGNHTPVNTGMKWSYCSLCDADLRMNEYGHYTEEARDGYA